MKLNYQESIRKILNWIDESYLEFRISTIKDQTQYLELIKPIGEFVLILELLKRWGIHPKKVKSYLDWAWNEFENGDSFITILTEYPNLAILLSIYASFYKSGYRNKNLTDLSKSLLKMDGCIAMELPRWRKIDMEYSASKMGIQLKGNCSLSGTWVSTLPEPWMISTEMAYAVTHEIFYYTDFGKHPNKIPTKIKEYLRLWLPAWLDIYIESENYDITAELISTSLCVKNIPKLEHYLNILLSKQRKNGVIPSPEGGGSNLIFEKDSKKRRYFLTNYHTTLVSLMAIGLYKFNFS